MLYDDMVSIKPSACKMSLAGSTFTVDGAPTCDCTSRAGYSTPTTFSLEWRLFGAFTWDKGSEGGARCEVSLESEDALLATDVAGTLDRWTRTAFASGGASRYDRALDLTYNTLKQHGGDHRIFDGSHDPIGAWRTIAEAFPDEGWLDRGEGYVSALWKDMVTPNGVPVVTWDKEAFDAVAGFLNETLGVSRNWSKDMVTFTATEFIGAALGALALVEQRRDPPVRGDRRDPGPGRRELSRGNQALRQGRARGRGTGPNRP
ncbi:MAG: hypothetical protein OXK74_09085 [Gemmatimonadota bacterium]|nr:hypothetical protein [Gemmatimonadota bacterium]